MAQVQNEDPPLATEDQKTDDGTRAFELACAYGSVKFSFSVPPNSYKYAEQQSVICHCHDCVDFPDAVFKASKERKTKEGYSGVDGIDVVNRTIGATEHIHFYKSDLVSVVGEEFIGSCRLYPKSDFVRFYCKSCGTPLAGQWSLLPGLFVYKKLLSIPGMDESSDAIDALFMPHSVAINHASAPPGSEIPDGVKVYEGMFVTPFMAKFFYRTAVGLVLGKGKADGIPTKDDVGVGIESISLATNA